MKLEDIPKKQPFEMPNEAHFDNLASKIYAQIKKEEQIQDSDKKAKSVSISSQQAEKTNPSKFWIKPQFMGIAATLLLLFVAVVGIYTYSSKSDTSSQMTLTMETQNIDFSKIPTEQISDFLLNENVSENELLSFIPQNSSLETNSIFEESDLNSIDAESLDLMLEEEYL